MLAVETELERIVAVLHDVVEDSDITLDQLRVEGFSEDAVAGIDALTKRDGDSKLEATARAKCNPVALGVKLADNADNQDMTRIGNVTEEDLARLGEYKRVRAFLESDL